MQEEIWKDVEGYISQYKVSNLGRVKSIRFGQDRIIPLSHNPVRGYYSTEFCVDGKRKRYYIHRLVAQHFIDNPNGYTQVNHLDGNKSNNNVLNLEWCTPKVNQQHYINVMNGGVAARAKLTKQQVADIKRLLEEGISDAELSRRFNVCAPNIRAIRLGWTWKDTKASEPVLEPVNT